MGFLASIPSDGEFDFPPQVIVCDFARVENIVLRTCFLTTNEAGGRFGVDDDAKGMVRELIEPVVDRAREEQGVD